jgi:hypothetical protein
MPPIKNLKVVRPNDASIVPVNDNLTWAQWVLTADRIFLMLTFSIAELSSHTRLTRSVSGIIPNTQITEEVATDILNPCIRLFGKSKATKSMPTKDDQTALRYTKLVQAPRTGSNL